MLIDYCSPVIKLEYWYMIKAYILKFIFAALQWQRSVFFFQKSVHSQSLILEVSKSKCLEVVIETNITARRNQTYPLIIYLFATVIIDLVNTSHSKPLKTLFTIDFI